MSEKKPRLLILTEDSKPQSGGIAEALHGLVLTLSSQYDVKILTSCKGASAFSVPPSVVYEDVNWFRSQFQMKGDGWFILRKINTLLWLWHKTGLARQYLEKALKEGPMRGIIIFRLSPVTHAWCAAARSLNLKYSVMIHGTELIETAGPIRSYLRRRDLRLAEQVFGISRATLDIARSLGVPDARLTKILAGLRPERLPQVSGSRDELLKRFSIRQKRFLFMIAYLIPRKGADLLLQAFAQVQPKFSDLALVIGGDGPERLKLEQMARSLGISEKVYFVGAVGDEDKAALYSACEFFVMPNRRFQDDVEGFGIVFLEAAYYGKASVGGENGGVPEAIGHPECGLLVDTSENAGPLAEALHTLLIDGEKTKQMGLAAQKRVTERFSWEETARPLFDFFSSRQTPERKTEAESPKDLKESAHALLEWLKRSSAAGASPALSSGYSLQSGWGGPYPEITGYTIPTYLKAAQRFQKPEWVQAAFESGRWLMETQLPEGAVCSKEWTPSNRTPSIFNTAQVIRGWCALYRESGESVWLSAAQRSAAWILQNQESDGRWVKHSFNQAARTYYAYVAWPLLLLARENASAAAKDAAARHLNWVVGRQDKDGWFTDAGFSEKDLPTTHTIGYVVEGLLEGGRLLEDAKMIAAAERASRILKDIYADRKFLPGVFRRGWKSEARWRCLTGDAQIALTWAKLGWREAALKMADDLRLTQKLDASRPEISGGIAGSEPLSGAYDPYRYPSHASKFMLDLILELP